MPLRINLETVSIAAVFWRDMADEVSIRKRKRYTGRGRAAALVDDAPCPRRWSARARQRQPRMRLRFMFSVSVESVAALFDCGVSSRVALRRASIRSFE